MPNFTLRRFDPIIGSNVLYKSGHADQLAATILRHANPGAEILNTDSGRASSTSFFRALALQGYVVTEPNSRFNKADVTPFRGSLLSY